MVVTQNEVTEQGERYLLYVNTKAKCQTRPAADPLSKWFSAEPVCLAERREKMMFFILESPFSFESSPFLYAFHEAEMFALTLEQPFLQGKEEERNYFFLRKEKDSGQ